MIILFLSLFLIFTGFIIGLGAVTVIDWHGLLAQNSSYWTVATTRTHKITKPLIWLGTILLTAGKILAYKTNALPILPEEFLLLGILILNGCFLSFVISPYLLKKEKEGKDKDLLPSFIQTKIKISFVFSFLGWWSLFTWTIYTLTLYLSMPCFR
jgi:hypothetical protein